jgi:cytochrome subunit of sulfide dehydrogenase
MKYPVPLALLWAATAFAVPAAAQGVDRQARVWAAACSACHGTEGRSPGAIQALAGRDADTLYRALIEFKTGQRPAATVMHQHTKGYTDDELRRIAQVFAGYSAK